MAKISRVAERRVTKEIPDLWGSVIRLGVLLSPFLLNDILFLSASAHNEPLRTWVDLLTSAWAASLLFLAWRLQWWNPLELLDVRAKSLRMQAVVGVGYGVGLVIASVPIRLLIWLGGRFSGFDLPFPGAWSGLEEAPVWAAGRIVLVSVLGALVDESAFRGAALQILRSFDLPGVRLTLISGGIYAAAHWSGGPLLWLTAFGFGCLWTILFQRIGLVGVIASHAVFDIITAFGFQQTLVGSWIAE